MGSSFAHPRRRQRNSIILAMALVPMLTFMGHWPEAVPIPGTNQYLSIPFSGHHSHETDDAHEHSQHCHGDSATCSDAPVVAGANFATVNEPVALTVVGALLWLVALYWWRPRSSTSLLPELQPPQRLSGA